MTVTAFKSFFLRSAVGVRKNCKLAAVFAEGLQKQQLCLVGTISADLYILQEGSRRALETTIQETVGIFVAVSNQGRQEGALSVTEQTEETADTFFSFLLGDKYLPGPAVVCNFFGVPPTNSFPVRNGL